MSQVDLGAVQSSVNCLAPNFAASPLLRLLLNKNTTNYRSLQFPSKRTDHLKKVKLQFYFDSLFLQRGIRFVYVLVTHADSVLRMQYPNHGKRIEIHGFQPRHWDESNFSHMQFVKYSKVEPPGLLVYAAAEQKLVSARSIRNSPTFKSRFIQTQLILYSF